MEPKPVPFDMVDRIHLLTRAAQIRTKFDDLIEAVGERSDRDAFAELFHHFAPRLKTYLLRLGTDEGMAEDVAQETMVLVWRKAAGFDRRQASASTWIFTIARNKRIDRLRRERRPEIDLADPAVSPSSEPPADDDLHTIEAAALIQKALEALPPEQAELIRLAYYEDKSHRMISAARDLPLGTVKSRIRLALTRLRHALRDLE